MYSITPKMRKRKRIFPSGCLTRRNRLQKFAPLVTYDYHTVSNDDQFLWFSLAPLHTFRPFLTFQDCQAGDLV